MPALHELQREFRKALLGNKAAKLRALIREDGIPLDTRLDIYRNNVFVSLKQVLRDTFPVVCRLVDERFFLYATDEFIRMALPEQAGLHAYGSRFANFLAEFPPCRDLVYLPDVARLEWLINVAAHAPDTAPLSPTKLSSLVEVEAPNLVFRLDPSLAYLESPWPIDRIWHANQPDADPQTAINLGAGGARLEVRRYGETVLFRSLDPATFILRSMLAHGHRLETATEAAFAADPSFEFTPAFADLFTDECVIHWSARSQSTQRISDE
jgi:Putative DNA-binding domain